MSVDDATPDDWNKLKSLKKQVGGDHYRDLAIQPIEFIVANDIPYREANVIKYVTRWRSKNGVEDLRKARHYLDMLIEEETERGRLPRSSSNS